MGVPRVPKEQPPPAEASAHWLSALTFHWVTRLVWIGARRKLDANDIWAAPDHLLESAATPPLTEALRRGGGRTLRPFVRVYGPGMAIAAVLKILWGALLLLPPAFFVPELMRVVAGDESKRHGWILVGCFAVTQCVSAIVAHWTFWISLRISLRARTALSAVVFDKALRLSSATSDTGLITNLVANDAPRMIETGQYMLFMLAGPVESLGAIALVAGRLGWSVVPSAVLMVLFYLFQRTLGAYQGKARHRGLIHTDRRVHYMSEILAAVKLVKLYVWERAFAKRVAATRHRELRHIIQSQVSAAVAEGVGTALPMFLALATFATHLLRGRSFSAEDAFACLGIFEAVRFPLLLVPLGVKYTTEAHVSMERLRWFLGLPEMQKRDPAPDDAAPGTVHAVGATLTWSSDSDESPEQEPDSSLSMRSMSSLHEPSPHRFQLRMGPFQLPPGACCAVVGSVGAGKSSLLSALLGQMRLQRPADDSVVAPRVWMAGRIAYAAQTPLVLNATVRENVLFGSDWDEDRYWDVVDRCQLVDDVSQMAGGDGTEVGEKGVTLSGGQRARLSLARAAYAPADIVLLDDPLAAVDAHVGAALFQRVIVERLQDRTVILATNALHVVSQCSHVCVLVGGRVRAFGPPSDAAVSAAVRSLESGRVVKAAKSPSASAVDTTTATITTTTSTTKMTATPHEPRAKRRARVARLERLRSSPHMRTQLVMAEGRREGSVAPALYWRYGRMGGPLWAVCGAASLVLVTQAAQFLGVFWVRAWVDDGLDLRHGSDDHRYMYGYLGVLCGFVVLAVARGAALATLALTAATRLHDAAFAMVLRARMSFFDSTPVGRILNRFSKDLDILDDLLSRSYAQLIYLVLLVVSTFGVIAVLIPPFIAFLLFMGAVFYWIQGMYRPSLRDVKRLEGTTRSPVHSHLATTLHGLHTIRAYGAEEASRRSFAEALDGNTGALYAQWALVRWLGVRLDFLSAIGVLVVACIAVGLRDELGGATAGVVLLLSLQMMSVMQYTARVGAETDSYMTAVERLEHFGKDLDVESDGGSPPTEDPWPSEGIVHFREVRLRYGATADTEALRGVDFCTAKHERIGVVGRSGAGKSSLVAALFRLQEISGGTIDIDGVDVASVPLQTLRGAIAVIPQEPTLFVGTVRSNLDPFDRHTDAELLDVLERVHLGPNDTPLRLESDVQAEGENLSVGERQLLCIARALLRQCAVYVLDEATASVDAHTDRLIQRTVREAFTTCTVLTIAHRLATIMDSDRVLVMDEGRAVEFDTPRRLLRGKKGVFRALVKELGPDQYRALRRVARGEVSLLDHYAALVGNGDGEEDGDGEKANGGSRGKKRRRRGRKDTPMERVASDDSLVRSLRSSGIESLDASGVC